MKSYEVVREIFNSCANNQMRDVFFDEVETDDPEEYIRSQLAGSVVTIESSDLINDVIVFDVYITHLRQRFSFTEF